MITSTYRKKQDMGVALVEYTLILVLVAVAVIAALLILGPAIKDGISKINDTLNGVQSNNLPPFPLKIAQTNPAFEISAAQLPFEME
jgi:Flp pilus assembly pilin Flp